MQNQAVLICRPCLCGSFSQSHSCLSFDPDTGTDLSPCDLPLSSVALSSWCCCLPRWLSSWARSVTAVCSPRGWGVESRNSRHHSRREKCCRGLPPVSQKWAMRLNYIDTKLLSTLTGKMSNSTSDQSFWFSSLDEISWTKLSINKPKWSIICSNDKISSCELGLHDIGKKLTLLWYEKNTHGVLFMYRYPDTGWTIGDFVRVS